MIKKNLVLTYFLLLLSSLLFSFDIGLEAGTSSFNYLELGINNKEDLYNISSSLIGITVRNSFSNFDSKISLKTQVPYNLKFKDALGSDDFNYLETLIYFGGNLQLTLLYPLTSNIYWGPLINYDFFYFEDYVIGRDDIYIYSILGAGVNLEYLYKFNKYLSFNVSGSFSYNFLALGSRVGDLKWSNNLNIGTGFLISFN